MKKITRLTALMLVLLMLCNLTVSATESAGGIPIEDLDMAAWSAMVEAAARFDEDEDAWGGPVLTDPCGEDNVYCRYITGTMANMSATQIHAYLSDLYENDYFGYIALLLHYGYYHLDSDLVCICEIPMSEPEMYPVGDLSAHTEADCPWKYENLSLVEQFEIANAAEDSSAYVAELSGEEQKQLVYSLKAGTTQAMYMEDNQLISITTGQAIANYNPETGAVTDCSMGLVVGYVVDGVIVSADAAK